MRPGGVTRDSQISKVIERTLVKKDEEEEGSWNVWKRSRIHTESDFESFPWEEASHLDLSKFSEVQRHLKPGMKIIAANGKIFTMTWMLMGFENFGVNLLLKPDFVKKVIEKIAQIQLEGIRNVAGIPNVAAVWAVDDIAFKSGPIISPRHYRKFIFPWYEEFIHIAHQHNLKVFFHTDGVLWDLLEDLIALGIDALHPIDPTCMDIDTLKTKVNKRVCLIGNISNQALEDGLPEEVAQLTKERLRTLAPGGGYILGSGNSVTDDARLENYLTMLETNKQYGRYPIRIPS